MTRFQEGDYVLVRGKVFKVGDDDELGYGVELFSKTDQYIAWVRPELVIEKVQTPLPPEPDKEQVVRDSQGDFWVHEDGTAYPWRCGDSYMTWESLFRDYGPVTVYEGVGVYE